MDYQSHASIVGIAPLTHVVATHIAAIALKIVHFAISHYSHYKAVLLHTQKTTAKLLSDTD